jgi:hypothetical protein
MTDPSLFIRWGDFQAGASGHFAIIALATIVGAIVFARWRGLR